MIRLTLVSEMSGTFAKRFLKCSCHLFSLSARLLAFSVDLFVDFLPLISSTIFHATAGRLLASTELISRILS